MLRPGVRGVRRLRLALLRVEVEQAGVVARVRVAEAQHQPRVDVRAVDQAQQRAVGLDAPILADAQEDDAVDGGLHRVVELALRQAGVAQGDIARQQVTPALDLGQEGRVHLGGAALGALRLDVSVEGALQDGLATEDAGDLVPALGILPIGDVDDAGRGRLVGFVGLDAAVVDRELLEVGEDAEGQLGAPGVAAQLVGGVESPRMSIEGFLASTKNLRVPPMRKQ